MAQLPTCKNQTCPKGEVFLVCETPTHWTFGCKTCRGVQVLTKPEGWKAGSQFRKYQRFGRPEYAREKAIFILGKNR